MVEHVPNKVPSKVPSKVSTASPSVTAYGKINEDEQPTYSYSEQYDAAIGSCPPNHTLYLLWLYDLVGDGWGSTKLAIKETSAASNSEDTIFVGSLDASNRVVKYEAGKQRRGLGVTHSERILGPSGSILGLAQGFADTPPDEGISSAKGFANGLEYGKGEENERNDGNQFSSNAQYLCLKPDVCYTAKVSGGTSLEEARWEVTRVKLLGTEVNIGSAVAKGVGTGAGVCNFSLGDSCAKTCDGELLYLSMFVVYLRYSIIIVSRHTLNLIVNETATAQNIEPTASPTTQRPTEALISTPRRPTSYISPKKPFVASASSENLVQDNGSASTFVASASSKNLVQDDGSASAFVASTSSENLVQDNDSASAFVAFRSSENLVQDDDSAS
jgi:hypothetical protein